MRPVPLADSSVRLPARANASMEGRVPIKVVVAALQLHTSSTRGSPTSRSPDTPPARWFNQLNPELKHEPFTAEEEALVRALPPGSAC